MTPDEALPLICGAAPFQDVNPDLVRRLLPSFRFRTYGAGETVWRQGDPATDLWFVLQGAAHSVHSNEDGVEVITQVAATGESFGEPALFLRQGKRLVSILTIGRTELASIAREPLLQFLEQHPAAMRRMLEALSRIAVSQSLMVGRMTFHDVRGRVAYQLLKFADEYGQDVDGGRRIPFRLSQSTLAGLVVASRESVNRALSALISEGVVTHVNGELTVLKPRALRRILESG